MKYCSMPFPLIIGPPKSIWISSFGSAHFGKGDQLQCGITDFRFLPISVQAFHSLAFASISRCIYGHQIFCASDSIAKLPGCVERMSAITASFIALYIAIRSSRQIHPCLTLRSRQYEKMYGLISRNLSGSSLSTQSRTSFRNASFPVMMASSFLLKILLRVSLKHRSCAASITLPNGVVSVFDEVLVAGVDGVVSEKLTRAFVGVDLFIFALGFLSVELRELF